MQKKGTEATLSQSIETALSVLPLLVLLPVVTRESRSRRCVFFYFSIRIGEGISRGDPLSLFLFTSIIY